jgi:transketolase
MNPLLKLDELGQSYWIDNLTRDMLDSGELRRRVEEQGLGGVTSNPTIFHKAIAGSTHYAAQIEQLAAARHSAADIYEALTVSDIRRACEVLRPRYNATEAADGFVSLEVSPHLAYDTEGSIAEAKHLFEEVNRPNLMIKIPGTAAGVPAIEACLFDGLNINITLLFSVPSYEAVANAYMRALERRRDAGRALDGISSVASFFLSRIDVLVDTLLASRSNQRTAAGTHAESLRGQAAVANAKLAYQRFTEILASERWQQLARQGARPQRVLWASTSTKDPRYSDVKYVEPLIGPHTVNTMPGRTIAAFADHGRAQRSVTDGVDEARRVMRDLRELGIAFEQVAWQLENEGVQKFIAPYDTLLDELERQRERVLSQQDGYALQAVARMLRRRVIEMTTAAGSGHPTSCLSAVDIAAALFFREMRWDPGDPRARNVDTFVLSKGHAAPLLWAALAQAGAIDEDPLTLRTFASTLEGHPTPRNPWVRVATGSLGQGLAAANGIALANRLDGIDTRVFCLLGDGECSEGSVWEAAQFASLNRLERVVAIVDVNALGQSAPAPYRHHTEVFRQRFEAFGWKALEIDGHDMRAVLAALYRSRREGPLAIIARTEKGKGVSFLEGADGWHGKALDEQQMQRALEELSPAGDGITVAPRRVGEAVAEPTEAAPLQPIAIDYEQGAMVATRDGFGYGLDAISKQLDAVVVLDGDVQNSTRTKLFMRDFPERAFESFISEQNMVGTALGLAACSKTPYVATFACFLTRAFDFIRMAAHSRPRHLVFCGSHAGVSIGEDGPSQMGLEDLAMFRAVLGSTVLYPSDGVSAARLTALAARTKGIVYLRTTRPKTPVLYAKDDSFTVGGSKTLRSSPHDALAVVAAGITVHEALAAHAALQARGVAVRVIDAYSVKPLDVATLERAARETKRLITVEDHYAEGGLGEAVAAAVGPLAPVHRLAVTKPPRSGKSDELLDYCGISRRAIEARALELLGRRPDATSASGG